MSYNNIGKIIQKAESFSGVVNTYDYTYDAVGQLTEVKKNGTTVETYTYDVNGNRTSRKAGISAAEIATYDAQDRLVTLGDVNYSFNVDGFLAQRGNDTFQYSAAGELQKATLANGTEITYIYDGMNRRIGRTVNGQTYKYLYGNLGNPYQVTATIEPDGTRTTYYYDMADMLFAIERGGVRYYVTTDQVGSPKLVIDSTGTVLKASDYDSFGKLYSDSNTGFYLPIGFAGGLADVDTGLVRFGMRDYDPAAGRWTAKDPLVFAGGHNLYGYVFNDPINLVDPTGEFAIIPMVGGALLGGGIDLGSQLLSNGGNLGCVDWKSVGKNALMGAIPGGIFGRAGRAFAKGRRANKLKPYPEAIGPHSTFKSPISGKITNYAEWKPNSRGGFDLVKRYDGTGGAHYNKVTRENLMPHVHDRSAPGGLRSPYSWEIP